MKMKKYRIKTIGFMVRFKQIYDKGLQLVHFVSATEMDRALCGQESQLVVVADLLPE